MDKLSFSTIATTVCTTLGERSKNTSGLVTFALDCCESLRLAERNISSSNSTANEQNQAASASSTWFFGLLFVTAVCVSTVIPLLLFPCMSKQTYQLTIKFLVSLAIGSLVATSCLFLIPEAFGITQLIEEHPQFAGYQFKCATVCGGLYLFLVLERLLKNYVAKKQQSGNTAENLQLQVTGDKSAETRPKGELTKEPIKPVAFMMLFGDSLVSLVDGLAIGSAFAMNLTTGISLSLAVLLEEIPHRFGDFAVMVYAGMSMKRAALCNLLCASTMYIGFVVSVLVGNAVLGASYYIFAIAAGMFLYLSLVDMLPELIHDEKDGKEPKGAIESKTANSLVSALNERWLFAVQNFAILLGFTIVFLLSIFDTDIEHAIQNMIR